jgi:hypothetical protein
LGTSGKIYNYDGGTPVDGPDAAYPQFLVAMPFTPKVNAFVTQVRVAIQYNSEGANQVNLSLYRGSGGIPKTLIAGPITVQNLAPGIWV